MKIKKKKKVFSVAAHGFRTMERLTHHPTIFRIWLDIQSLEWSKNQNNTISTTLRCVIHPNTIQIEESKMLIEYKK